MADFSKLIGLTIDEARKKIGYWWVCEHCQVNPPIGFYNFGRSAGARLELRTNNNVVISEHHNGMAEFYTRHETY